MTTALPKSAAALVARASAPEFTAWRRNIVRLGGCTNPIHLVGAATVYDTTTGAALLSYGSDVYGGRLLTACGNRRATVCPACSGLYRADTYQLVRAGLVGGKEVPEAVGGHPRVFATLTAPGFGPGPYPPGTGGRARTGLSPPAGGGVLPSRAAGRMPRASPGG
ncbi:putative Zn-finger protein [Streptomyces sp. B3I8]|nr:putative Zn-finger protein [Streptomyces sp. B3I8]